MNIFLHFFQPYFWFLYGAAYNVEQTLEGLRIVSSNFIAQDSAGRIISSYWSPGEAAMPILGLLLLYFVLLIMLVTLAGYALHRWKGSLAAVSIVLLPGVVSLIGYFPSVNFLPRVFVIQGAGTLGSASGMVPLVLLAMLTGWSMVVILTDTLILRDRFRHLYDHGWYAAAILAGVFFVADLDAAHTARELEKLNQTSRQASAYLLNQVKAYDLVCQNNKAIESRSCIWASLVQQTLNNYASEGEDVFHFTGPTSTLEVYDPTRKGLAAEEVLVIRRELKRFNQSQCPEKALGEGIVEYKISGTCQMPPASICGAFPEPLDGDFGRASAFRSAAIASECIIPSLVASRQQQEKIKGVVDEDKRQRHWRWLYYILFSMAAGGKVANSTVRMVNIDGRPEADGRRCLRLLLRAVRLFVSLVRAGLAKGGAVLRLLGAVLRRMSSPMRPKDKAPP